MPGHRPPSNFNRHNRGHTFQKGDHGHPQHLQERMFVVRHLPHARRQRSHQSVAQENAQKRPHQRRCYLASNFLRRAAQALIVITTPSTAATMPSPGSESAIVTNPDTGWLAS